MKRGADWLAFIGVIALLGVVLLVEGKKSVQLQSQIPLSAKELYSKLAHSQVKLQILDVRTGSDGYEDSHIPGAIPLPGGDLASASSEVRERVFSYVPTLVVSSDGDSKAFEACRANFPLARNLAGGMTAWTSANYPEDSGEWVPPKNHAGGGCL
jgi:rhodanese-related sulfurtransferase